MKNYLMSVERSREGLEKKVVNAGGNERKRDGNIIENMQKNKWQTLDVLKCREKVKSSPWTLHPSFPVCGL